MNLEFCTNILCCKIDMKMTQVATLGYAIGQRKKLASGR